MEGILVKSNIFRKSVFTNILLRKNWETSVGKYSDTLSKIEISAQKPLIVRFWNEKLVRSLGGCLNTYKYRVQGNY